MMVWAGHVAQKVKIKFVILVGKLKERDLPEL
jgi:hypothetical protein